ncbi:MAG: AMP-binding protein, partial [Spirochaetia bacterium]|nr:AMP-binding protein [Spirochaetia bacterium]
MEKLNFESVRAKALARLSTSGPIAAWKECIPDLLRSQIPFSSQQALHQLLFEDWDASSGPAPVWIPDAEDIENANVTRSAREWGLSDYSSFYIKSIAEPSAYWAHAAEKCGIRFRKKSSSTLDTSNGIEIPHWFPGAAINIAESCFQADEHKTAIVSQKENGEIRRVSYKELKNLAFRVAASLRDQGLKTGDGVGLCLPMTVEALAAYLGIVLSGLTGISIADSFSPEEIAVRLRIGKAKLCITQDVIRRDAKSILLYERFVQADAVRTVVLAEDRKTLAASLRGSDLAWDSFLSEREISEAEACDPEAT